MALIDDKTLREIHEAALSARLAGSREALMGGIDDALVDGIATAPSRRDQVLVDLDALSKMNVAEGAPPLAVWLENAAQLARGRVEEAVFARARAGLGGNMGARAAAVVSIARLPATGRELFGREGELGWLDGCWRDGVHVASVVAWGGVGKSALVNKWLAGLRDKGWDGAERVYGWSFYSQGTDRLSSSDEFVDAALRWFGDKEPGVGSAWDKGERLAGLVREHRTILVLDGVEPLQWGPGVQAGRFKDPALEALLKELAGHNKGLCLVTSRIGLADLDGLSGSRVQEKKLDSLSAEHGALLLEKRGTKGAPEDLRAASDEYDGHCLSLTLLGNFIREAHRGDIRKRDTMQRLEGEPATRMIAAYEKWFARKPEIAVLRMLGFFDRPAPEDEIAVLKAKPAIRGITTFLPAGKQTAWNKAVTSLRDVGLLAPAAEHERGDTLDAHPLVRQHFAALVSSSHPAAWREGHRRLYEHLKQSAKELPETIEEMAPLYAAVVHGCMAGKNQEAFVEVYWKRILRGKEHFSWHKLGAFGSEVAVLSAFFAPPWERLAPGLSEPDQAFVLNQAGSALRALGRLSEAAGLMRLSLDVCIAQEDWREAAISASNLSELLQTHGELSEALAQARKSVELADKSGDAFERMSDRTTLAAAQHAMDLGAEAAAQFEEAERMQKERQPAYPLLYSLQGFLYCDLLLDQGRDAKVRERAAQTLEWGGAGYSLLSIALDHLSLGRAHLLGAQHGTSGDLAEASSHLNQAVDGLRRAGDQQYFPLGLLARAALHTHTRHYDRAHHDIEEALSLATRCEFRLHAADAHLAHTRLALAEHNPAAARDHLTQARAIIIKTEYHRRDAELTELAKAIAVEPRPSGSGPEPRASASGTTSPVATPAALYTSPEAPSHGPLPYGRGSGPLPYGRGSTSTGRADARGSEPPSIAMPNIPAFPQPILDAYKNRTLAVLFGSGLSMAPDVKPRFPRWTELPERLFDEAQKHAVWNPKQIQSKRDFLKDGYVSLESMLAELDTLKTAFRRVRKYRAALTSIFMPSGPTPGDVHRALVDLGVDVLVTTNYDELLEAVEGPPTRRVYTWLKSDKALDDIREHRKVLFKIHGTADDDDSVVMTQSEYTRVAADTKYQAAMSFLLQRYTFLLVGFGINDPLDLDLVFGLNAGAFGVAATPHHALMHKSVSPSDRDRWAKSMNVHVLPYDDHGDLPAILRALAQNPRNPP